MSKANSRNIKRLAPEEIEIRQRYTEYRKTLPNQYPTDSRTGYPMRRTSEGHTILPRSLTPEERTRFYNSLPPELQKFRELNALQTSIERLESVDDHEWYEDDEDYEMFSEERESPMTNDLIAYEHLGLDIAWIPEATEALLTEEEYTTLMNSPAVKQRESIWDRRKPKNRRQRRREELKRMTREEAERVIAKYLRQEEQVEAYLKTSSVTYVAGKPIIYFDKRPGIWKGYAPRVQ